MPHKKNQLATAFKESKCAYVAELFSVFKELEVKKQEEVQKGEEKDSLNSERLLKFGQLVKSMLLLGDIQMIESLMQDRFYLSVFGAIEILPEFKDRLNCRKFFEECKFKVVVPI